MDKKFFVNNVLNDLSKSGRIFFYGFTSIAVYKKKQISVFKILTDLNIAKLAEYIPDLQFSGDLRYDSYFFIKDTPEKGNKGAAESEIIVTFFIVETEGTEETGEKDDFSYLKNFHNADPGNPLFQFFYSFKTKKFYSFSDSFFTNLKKDVYYIEELKSAGPEDIFDISHILSEIDMMIVIKNIHHEYIKDYFAEFDFVPYLPFINAVLTSKFPFRALTFLEDIGILKFIFPFLNKLRGVEQDRSLHPEGDVFEHTLTCFQFVKNPSLRLAFGLLLHDYGKAFKAPIKGFREHSNLGAREVRRILKPLGFNEPFIKDVEFLVEYHMINSYFYRISDWEKNEMFNNERGIDLLKLFKADTMGSIGKLDTYVDIISRLKKNKIKVNIN
jgi:hypothetical protein